MKQLTDCVPPTEKTPGTISRRERVTWFAFDLGMSLKTATGTEIFGCIFVGKGNQKFASRDFLVPTNS
jgi:hypothetical protein